MDHPPLASSALRPAAIFDFDGTLLRGDSTLLLLAEMIRRQPAALLDALRLAAAMPAWWAGRRSRDELKSIVVRGLRRIPAAGREAFFERFHDEVLAPRYRPAALERIRWHAAEGHTLVLGSASIEPYMRLVARRLGFHYLVSTRIRLDEAPGLAGAACRAEEKVRLLSALDFFPLTDWTRSWSYSDTLSDLPLFALSAHPVAINPRRDLRLYASSRGWTILNW